MGTGLDVSRLINVMVDLSPISVTLPPVGKHQRVSVAGFSLTMVVAPAVGGGAPCAAVSTLPTIIFATPSTVMPRAPAPTRRRCGRAATGRSRRWSGKGRPWRLAAFCQAATTSRCGPKFTAFHLCSGEFHRKKSS